MIEAAIALPPTVLLLFVMFDAGRMMHNHHIVSQVVSDTLLFGSTLPDIEADTAEYSSGAYQGCAADASDPQCSKLRTILFHARTLIESDPRLNLEELNIRSVYTAADNRIDLVIGARYMALFPTLWQHMDVSASGGVPYRY